MGSSIALAQIFHRCRWSFGFHTSPVCSVATLPGRWRSVYKTDSSSNSASRRSCVEIKFVKRVYGFHIMEAFQGYLGSPEFSWGDLRHVGDVVTIWEKGFLTQRSNSTSTHKIQYVTVSKPERHCWHRTEFSRMSVMKSRAVHGSHVEEFFPF